MFHVINNSSSIPNASYITFSLNPVVVLVAPDPLPIKAKASVPVLYPVGGPAGPCLHSDIT